jgi:predicted NUDIX family NTP pyrophosphohydrolase
LLGRVVGVTVRYGSFGHFRVRREPDLPMPKLSAGLLLYRRTDDGIQVLVAHPGGPLWARRDSGAWSPPKGAPEDHEDDLFGPPAGSSMRRPPRGARRARDRPRRGADAVGKVVAGVEGDLDPRQLRSMEAEIEWPPRSGQRLRVPEIDQVAWVGPTEARRRLNPAQASFVDRLLQALARLP